ncbi:MAG: 50S ribosomal protein L19 [Patescibacteria group bacterium]|nr:50S ribosomal protein L19 [Patescibacteria group bacterium]
MAIKISPVDMDARKKMDLKAGDTVRVFQKIEEKGKTRLQAFEGLVLARKHGREAGATFTVRRVSSGVGVEKIFPLYSPMIDRIEVVKRARVRRAKLYYIRDKAAREARRQLRKTSIIGTSTADIEKADAAEEEGVPADFSKETEAEKEHIVEEMTAPTDDKEEKPAEGGSASGGKESEAVEAGAEVKKG